MLENKPHISEAPLCSGIIGDVQRVRVVLAAYSSFSCFAFLNLDVKLKCKALSKSTHKSAGRTFLLCIFTKYILSFTF